MGGEIAHTAAYAWAIRQSARPSAAAVSYAKELMHGKQSKVYQGRHQFVVPRSADRNSRRLVITRWRRARRTFPEALKVTAESDDGEIMALEHREYPVFGVQFHPESVMTPDGVKMIENFMEVVRND